MRRWDGLLDRYLKECETRGLARATVQHRAAELGRFGQWIKQRRPKPNLEDVDGEIVVRFISDRSAFRSRSTVSGVVSDLRGMGEFLAQEGVWRKNPLRWIRGPKLDPRRNLPKRIDKEHMRALWGAARERRQEHSRYQAVCLLSILYGTGIRSGELKRLNVTDWSPETATLRVDGTKTSRQRCIAVSEAVWRCIEAYMPRRQNQLEETGRREESALLVNRKGERMNPSNVRSLLKRLAESAGVPQVTMHRFRHSCASDLLESGERLPTVQRVLGHACIESTFRYVDIADPARAAAMEKHPVNRFLGATAQEEGR